MNHTGVIVGCDRTLECLLPWWWSHYSTHNDIPVAFADFGMSEQALAWCKQRGICLTLPQVTVLDKREIPQKTRELWETLYGTGIWNVRSAWFLKPVALLHCPFDTGLWIDIDCQVRGSLTPLFNSLNLGAEIGLVKEPKEVQEGLKLLNVLHPEEIYYYSGVILFRKQAPILHHWLQEALENNAEHTGDQGALSRAIFHHPPALIELPSSFNWLSRLGPNPEACIIHFSGNEKLKIINTMDPQLGS